MQLTNAVTGITSVRRRGTKVTANAARTSGSIGKKTGSAIRENASGTTT